MPLPPNARLLTVAAVCAAVLGGMAMALQWQGLVGSLGVANSGDTTASLGAAGEPTGKSTGLPLPRFVTLKAGRINVRRGPSSDHPVAFIFQRRGLPVEITAEFENWRKIRDSDGAEGWILQSMLSGRRNAYVAAWASGKVLELHVGPDLASGLVARLSPGVLAAISRCDGQWCEISSDGHEGYAEQNQLWGVYPGEMVD